LSVLLGGLFKPHEACGSIINMTNVTAYIQSQTYRSDACRVVPGGAGWCRVRRVVPCSPGGAGWCRVVPGGAGWCRVVPGGAGGFLGDYLCKFTVKTLFTVCSHK
jgi:hypothetical protein